jgi:hypothetical protein
MSGTWKRPVSLVDGASDIVPLAREQAVTTLILFDSRGPRWFGGKWRAERNRGHSPNFCTCKNSENVPYFP